MFYMKTLEAAVNEVGRLEWGLSAEIVIQEEEGHDNGYHWINGTKNKNGIGPYSFEVVFEIKKVKTWIFPNGEKSKEYLRLEDSEVKDDELLNWLNSLCGLGFSSSSNVKEIEYTKEIGLLFRKMILFIFNINENIHHIFGEKFDLTKINNLKLIEGKGILLDNNKSKN